MSFYRYAAYGSNLHLLRLKKRVSSARHLGVSFISGYDLRFHKKSSIDGSGKCSICIGNHGVHIAVFEIKSSQKADLDRIEGLGKGYTELQFRDPDFGLCMAYIADPAAIDESLRPMNWYKELVLIGCRSNEFPDEYIRKIEDIETIEDSDNVRSREQWRIVEEIRKGT